jgi:hypothetical protein
MWKRTRQRHQRPIAERGVGKKDCDDMIVFLDGDW